MPLHLKTTSNFFTRRFLQILPQQTSSSDWPSLNLLKFLKGIRSELHSMRLNAFYIISRIIDGYDGLMGLMFSNKSSVSKLENEGFL